MMRSPASTRSRRSSSARIISGGQSQSASAKPDCALLLELRAAMKALVDTQRTKWAYMFDKLDKELAR